MTPQLLLDTNIIILHLANKADQHFPPQTAALSVLSLFELLRYPGMTNQEINALRDIISNCIVIEITRPIAERAAELGRTRTTRAVDLLLAATALEHTIPLITRNIRDFKDIPNLEVRDHF